MRRLVLRADDFGLTMESVLVLYAPAAMVAFYAPAPWDVYRVR
jgi:hypothetical protein